MPRFPVLGPSALSLHLALTSQRIYTLKHLLHRQAFCFKEARRETTRASTTTANDGTPTRAGTRPPRAIQPQTARRWLLFVHQLPSSPSNLRVRTWRRLQQLGALPIKQAVYVLPDTPTPAKTSSGSRRRSREPAGSQRVRRRQRRRLVRRRAGRGIPTIAPGRVRRTGRDIEKVLKRASNSPGHVERAPRDSTALGRLPRAAGGDRAPSISSAAPAGTACQRS